MSNSTYAEDRRKAHEFTLTPVFNAGGECIGITIHSTTYSPQEIARLAQRLEQVEAERAALAKQVAQLQELLNDRESDLSYEYDARMHAEAIGDVDALIIAQFADHAPGCDVKRGFPETCTCGYNAAFDRLRAIPEPPLANTPLDRIVALGRAALTYAEARETRQATTDPEVPATAMVVEAREAYLEALDQAMKGGRS